MAEDVSRQCKPGGSLLAWYSDDDVYHERLLVWPVVNETTDCRWVIQTPDGDLYVEPLGTSSLDGPER
eukprot:6480411-Amphidinium_carterae.1